VSVANTVFFSSLVAEHPKIVGHQIILEELSRDLSAKNLAHAYLFSGPRHLGKMAVARWFAEQLLTDGVPEEKLADVRRNIGCLTHPDLLILDQLWIEGTCTDWDVVARTSNVPQQHRAKKPAAKTDTISIDDVRALQERLHDTGTGQFRCCIIRAMERMQVAAANAFLKILEEPPEGLVFILTSQSASILLPTVVSRARSLLFRRLPNRELLTLLEGSSASDRQFILRIAQGAPGVVARLMQDTDQLREHKLVHEQALSFWGTTSLADRLRILQPLQKRGAEAERLLLHLALTLRERGVTIDRMREFQLFAQDLQTNAHRQLLAQRFAFSID